MKYLIGPAPKKKYHQPYTPWLVGPLPLHTIAAGPILGWTFTLYPLWAITAEMIHRAPDILPALHTPCTWGTDCTAAPCWLIRLDYVTGSADTWCDSEMEEADYTGACQHHAALLWEEVRL